MNAVDAFGPSNTILPVALLLALAVCVPVLTVSPRVMTQRALARGMLAAISIVLLFASLLFAELYRREGNDIVIAFLNDPLGRSAFFVSRGLMSAMFWGPIIAFVWFGRAIEVERRKGEAKVREGKPQ